jgi:hypothetical protein
MTPNIIDIYNEGQEEWSTNIWPSGTIHISNSVIKHNAISVYALIADPQYNFIPTLLQSTKFTDAFWEYVQSKPPEYSGLHCPEGCGMVMLENYDGVNQKIPSAMLVGFVIDYIQELL